MYYLLIHNKSYSGLRDTLHINAITADLKQMCRNKLLYYPCILSINEKLFFFNIVELFKLNTREYKFNCAIRMIHEKHMVEGTKKRKHAYE